MEIILLHRHLASRVLALAIHCRLHDRKKLKPLRLAGQDKRRVGGTSAINAVCILHIEIHATPSFRRLRGGEFVWPPLQKSWAPSGYSHKRPSADSPKLSLLPPGCSPSFS